MTATEPDGHTALDEVTATALANGWAVEPGSWAFERVYRKSRRVYVRVTFDACGRIVEGATARRGIWGKGKRERVLAELTR